MATNSNRLHDEGFPKGICPLCGGDVQEVRRAGHWLHHDLSGGYWFSGRCINCDVDFSIGIGSGATGEWGAVAPAVNSLKTAVTDADLAALTAKLSRYPKHDAKWQSFLARRRDGDELRWFNTDDDRTGVAAVRNGLPIAQFYVNRLNLGSGCE